MEIARLQGTARTKAELFERMVCRMVRAADVSEDTSEDSMLRLPTLYAPSL